MNPNVMKSLFPSVAICVLSFLPGLVSGQKMMTGLPCIPQELSPNDTLRIDLIQLHQRTNQSSETKIGQKNEKSAESLLPSISPEDEIKIQMPGTEPCTVKLYDRSSTLIVEKEFEDASKILLDASSLKFEPYTVEVYQEEVVVARLLIRR